MGYLIVSRKGFIGQTGFFQKSISWQKIWSDRYESKSRVMIGYPNKIKKPHQLIGFSVDVVKFRVYYLKIYLIPTCPTHREPPIGLSETVQGSLSLIGLKVY